MAYLGNPNYFSVKFSHTANKTSRITSVKRVSMYLRHLLLFVSRCGVQGRTQKRARDTYDEARSRMSQKNRNVDVVDKRRDNDDDDNGMSVL